MKLIGPSSVLVTWDEQVADSFTLRLYLDTTSITRRDITGTSYTFTEVPGSSQYRFRIYAVSEGLDSIGTDYVTITTYCKSPNSYFHCAHIQVILSVLKNHTTGKRACLGRSSVGQQ